MRPQPATRCAERPQVQLKAKQDRVDRRCVSEEYFVSWQGDLRANRAGEGARRKAAELRQGRSLTDAVIDTVVGRRDAGWSWAKGAVGEEAVARSLATLPPTHWRVLHDLPIGARGANIDHLVLGPPGVFTLNTKHLSGRVDVSRDEVRRNGRSTRYLESAIREADRVRAVLEHHITGPVQVEALLVVYGADVRVRSQPRDVSVLTVGQLTGWLQALPQVLTFEQWQRCCRTATTPATWTAREPPRGQRLDTPTGPASVTRWQRHGHDRLYVRSIAGHDLGWADLSTGEVHAGSAEAAEAVRQALTTWLRA